MDVNYFLTREQIERFLARASTDPGARAAHEGMADLYRGTIEAWRRAHDPAGTPAGSLGGAPEPQAA